MKKFLATVLVAIFSFGSAFATPSPEKVESVTQTIIDYGKRNEIGVSVFLQLLGKYLNRDNVSPEKRELIEAIISELDARKDELAGFADIELPEENSAFFEEDKTSILSELTEELDYIWDDAFRSEVEMIISNLRDENNEEKFYEITYALYDSLDQYYQESEIDLYEDEYVWDDWEDSNDDYWEEHQSHFDADLVSGQMGPEVTFQVRGDTLYDPRHNGSDVSMESVEKRGRLVWAKFISLIPKSKRTDLVEYIVYDGSEDGTLAYVEKASDREAWVMGIDVSVVNVDGSIDDLRDFYHTLIHEFAHILTLRESQVDPDDALEDADFNQAIQHASTTCETHFIIEGCVRKGSYIYAFFNAYWRGEVFDIHSQIDQYDYDALQDFYDQNSEKFVSDYAATNLGEDIAESFTAFVLRPKPQGNSVADQKVLFFYDYSELVELRKAIRITLAQ